MIDKGNSWVTNNPPRYRCGDEVVTPTARCGTVQTFRPVLGHGEDNYWQYLIAFHKGLPLSNWVDEDLLSFNEQMELML